jgi:glucose/arabinose dehydrogenase
MKTLKRFGLGLITLTLTIHGTASVANGAVSSQLFASGLSSPLFVTYAPGDSTRVFIVQRSGQIRLVKSGSLIAAPFLDIAFKLVAGNEQGLLGLAFHPQYQVNGYFYVDYTRSSDGATVIERYSVGGDPDVADGSSGLPLLTIAQPQTNHNGGCLQFGPDGMLYIGMGDGGGANDQHGTIGNAQNPATLLGKILRLDVDNSPSYIPSDNPWAGVQAGEDTLDEIWAMGVRNPWRFSFDRQTGDLLIGDVGQSAWEEIDFQSAASSGGENYGWRCMEGSSCSGNGGCTCFAANLTNPIHEYDHNPECSITGGYVYRGCAIPELDGEYFFGDYCSGAIWSIRQAGGVVTDTTDWTSILSPTGISISSFGEDYFGELYVCDLGGDVYKIVSDNPACGVECSCPSQSDFDEDTFITALDLGAIIDILFAGDPDVQDSGCPVPRGDFDCDDFTTALDLSGMIDYLFASGPGPCDPCS